MVFLKGLLFVAFLVSGLLRLALENLAERNRSRGSLILTRPLVLKIQCSILANSSLLPEQ